MGRSPGRVPHRIRKHRAHGQSGGHLGRLSRTKEELNRELTAEFRAILLRYAHIMPPQVTSLAELQQDLAACGGPDGDPGTRPARLLYLAGAHVRDGYLGEAVRLLSEARMLVRERTDDMGPLRLLLMHMRLKAKAAQGLLPMKRNLLRDGFRVTSEPIDINLPATQLCLCSLLYKFGARRMSMLGAEQVLVAAASVYELDDPALSDGQQIMDSLAQLTAHLYNAIISALRAGRDAVAEADSRAEWVDPETGELIPVP